ncbi:MAG: DapH/DapD/GlmU-related protein [Pseudomonadota bacterium]
MTSKSALPALRIDTGANRASRKWTRREQAARVLWALALPLFRLSPRPLWGWRRALLRLFGARVGAGAHVYPDVRIAMPWNLSLGDNCAVGAQAILYALGPIHIADRATISQYAHLCAGSHDWRDPAMPLTKPPIAIGEDAWVCADAFVGPGVAVGPGAIVGARCVLMSSCRAGAIMAGNPARQIGRRDGGNGPCAARPGADRPVKEGISSASQPLQLQRGRRP